MWRGLWRGVLAVHEFSFWAWVRRQAYPNAWVSSSRYDRWASPRYDQLIPNESQDSSANAVDRYAR